MIAEKIIQFPGAAVEEREYGACSERGIILGSAIRAYKRALEGTDLTNHAQVEEEIKPLYDRILAKLEENRVNPVYAREGCVSLFKYAHERQLRDGALRMTMTGGLETHLGAEDPHNQPPAKRAA